MSHEPSQRYPEGRTTQPGARPVASATPSSSRFPAGRKVLYFPAPSLSLLGTSPGSERAGPGGGYQDRLHGQALARPGRATAGLCYFDRADLERTGQSCCFEVTEPRARTWLKDRRMVNGWPFGWNIG